MQSGNILIDMMDSKIEVCTPTTRTARFGSEPRAEDARLPASAIRIGSSAGTGKLSDD
jgi:hypothetical protein